MVEYRSMEQMQEQPIHWDNHRTNLNLTFIFALIVAVIGILGQPVLFVLGIGVAIYSWLTNPKQYLIYRDALVIYYGRPRRKSYPFQEIAHLETLSLPMGERLRVRMVNGRRLLLLTKDPDTFRTKLDEALDAFHGEQRGSDYSSENGSESPRIIEPGVPTTENNAEQVLGIDPDKMSKTEICQKLEQEFLTWNSRIQSLATSEERETAQNMLNLISQAQIKYCGEVEPEIPPESPMRESSSENDDAPY